jgi:twitching motility protein PilT
MSEIEQKFLTLLQAAIQHKSSDIHLMTHQPPAIRSHQGLLPVNMPPLSPEDMLQLCKMMVTDPNLKENLQSLQDYDGSFDVKGLGRFRYNVYRTVHGMGAVLRVIGQKVPSIKELNLPPVLEKIAEASRGLVLVTGATGSGKSSTLAAMIDHLNSTQNLHILTIEDPIEFLHPQKKCRVSQREIGRDTKNFAVALKSALRQDPDVILVGEMRDYETLDIAMKAAETGHLVFSTVHTSDAMKTIGRLISLFPPQEQNSARIRLADNLHAIVSQRLVPGIQKARVVAQEILINNLGIQDCIANEKKTGEIPSFVEKGKEVSGMQTFDQHLAELVHTQQVSAETALEFATNPSDFQRNLSFGSHAIEGESGIQTEGNELPEVAPEANSSATPSPTPPLAKPSTPGKTGLTAIPAMPKIPKPPGAA